jgi:hypothetical protein
MPLDAPFLNGKAQILSHRSRKAIILVGHPSLLEWRGTLGRSVTARVIQPGSYCPSEPGALHQKQMPEKKLEQ